MADGPSDIELRRRIGAVIRAKAEARGESLAAVAKAIDVEVRTFGLYAEAKRKPNFATIYRICKYLGTTPSELFGWPSSDAELSAAEHELVRAYRAVPDFREALLNMARGALRISEGSLAEVSGPQLKLAAEERSTFEHRPRRRAKR